MTDLAKLTWPEARARFDANLVALLPIGATEPHGPHLPLDTDVTIAVGPRRRRLAGFQQGTVFGEMSLLDGAPRPSTKMALQLLARAAAYALHHQARGRSTLEAVLFMLPHKFKYEQQGPSGGAAAKPHEVQLLQ